MNSLLWQVAIRWVLLNIMIYWTLLQDFSRRVRKPTSMRRPVALSKKELSKARGYLEPFATLPIAYNDMGILCLLEGNRDKAEVYLTMAAAAGVEQAIKALEKLKIKD